uniref:Uncharacterized protein n=1 Tax=Physcomitrium patens TaxID=3218 RepID=A0A2K1JDM1_PHYPA|nr:hypothetical protein PHYPA_019902 [Physcomitrium patens]
MIQPHLNRHLQHDAIRVCIHGRHLSRPEFSNLPSLSTFINSRGVSISLINCFKSSSTCLYQNKENQGAFHVTLNSSSQVNKHIKQILISHILSNDKQINQSIKLNCCSGTSHELKRFLIVYWSFEKPVQRKEQRDARTTYLDNDFGII